MGRCSSEKSRRKKSRKVGQGIKEEWGGGGGGGRMEDTEGLGCWKESNEGNEQEEEEEGEAKEEWGVTG